MALKARVTTAVGVSLVLVLVAAPALAQWGSGSPYDLRSGNRSGNQYRWQHNPDGSTDVRGFDFDTGSPWRTTIQPNGDMRGIDSRGNHWRYNESSGQYWNTDGPVCVGSGQARACY